MKRLNRGDRSLGIGYLLTAGEIAHQDVTLIGKRNDARGKPVAFRVGMTFASLPSMTATTELVVPKSIPMIFSPPRGHLTFLSLF